MSGPIQMYRDATCREVKELCKAQGLEYEVYYGADHREYFANGTDGSSLCLGWVGRGGMPDWREMLRRLGSDWA